MKTIKVLPNVNDFAFCGRVIAEPTISASGNVCRFSLIRNFGGNKAPVIVNFVFYKPKDGFPEFLKKGAPITAHAYVKPDSWTDKEGVEHEEVIKVIKTVELATLVEKKIRDNAPATTDATGEEAIEVSE